MALRTLTELVERAKEKFGALEMSIVHRVGRVPVRGDSVVLACAAAHRSEAFAAWTRAWSGMWSFSWTHIPCFGPWLAFAGGVGGVLGVVPVPVPGFPVSVFGSFTATLEFVAFGRNV